MSIVKSVLAAALPAACLIAIAVAAAVATAHSARAQSSQAQTGTGEIVLRLDNGKTVTIFRHTIFRDDRGFMHFSIFTFMGDQEFAVNCGTQAWFSKAQGHEQWAPSNPLDDAFFRLVCSAGGQTQFDEGRAAYDRGDYAAALRLWTPLAQQGHAKAQEAIGTMYYEGRGVARDYGAAFRWFRGAADQGDPNAPCYLGVMYHDGLGVAMDRAEAARWYRRAADQGTAIAQVNLGAAYADGDGVTRDDAEAVRWYRKAADQGHALGQNNLAYMYEIGRGVVRDRALAIAWYRKAAQQGNTLAQNNLSRLEAESGGSALPASWRMIVNDDGSTLYYDLNTVNRNGQYAGAALINSYREPHQFNYASPAFSYQSNASFVWIDCSQDGRPYHLDYILYYGGRDLTGPLVREMRTRIFYSDVGPTNEAYTYLLSGGIFLKDRIC